MRRAKGEKIYYCEDKFYKKESPMNIKTGDLIQYKGTSIVEIIETKEDILSMRREDYEAFTPVDFYISLDDKRGVLYKEEIK